ncbi:MAG TPA: DMT family transporter [Xanthomonadales bacterium]|nr:DMT family transporter [Xanthomonadales bacterium]
MNPTILMLVGAALISTSAVFVRWAEVAPTVSAFWRMAFGAALLAPIAWRAARGMPLPRRRTLALLAVAAAFFALDLFLWHRSILYVGPGLATLLANFQVFILAFVGIVWLRERVSLKFWLAVLLSLAGLWLLVGADWRVFTDAYRAGVWLGLGTAGAYAGYLLSMRRAQSGPRAPGAEVGLWWSTALCAAMLALQVVAEGERFAIPDGRTLAALLAYAAIAQVIGWIAIVRAMPRLPASTVGLLLLLQPSLAFAWDVLLFGRVVDAGDAAGIACSLAGIFLGTTRNAAPAPLGERRA